MKETFGQKTRRSHKRNQRVVMFWCAFVFAFVIGHNGRKAGLDFRGRIEYNSTRKGVAGRRLAPTYH